MNMMEGMVKVRVRLKRSQYTGHLNKWICTIHGEKREVTMQNVEWWCISPEDATHSFKVSEIESFTVMGQYPN